MARHTRGDGRDEETTTPRPAADLLREAGYELPETRRRRRRERGEEFTLPPPPERMMFPYRRATDIDRAQELTQPAPPELTHRSRPAALAQPAQAPVEAARPEPASADVPRSQEAGWQEPGWQEPAWRQPEPRRPSRSPQTQADPVLARWPSGGARPEWTEAPRLVAVPSPRTGQQRPLQPVRQEPREPRQVERLPTELGVTEQWPADSPAAEQWPTDPGVALPVPAEPAGGPDLGNGSPATPRQPAAGDPDGRPRLRLTDDAEHAGATGPEQSRSLLRDWLLFIVETLLAAGLGLALWLGFHTLWRAQPYLAAAGSGVVLVGLHTMAGWIRRRQTGGGLDLFTSAAVVAVGVAITVLPAAFAIPPG
jgi:hypothetical protein